jgi:hypothetical protein
MKTPRKLLVLPLLATTLIAFGCGDGGTGIDEGSDQSTMSFSFTDGTTSNSFTASGQVQMSQGGDPQFGTWAAGGRTPTNELIVAAFRARTSPRGDLSFIYVPNIATPRNVTISEACFDTGADCPVMYLILNTPFVGEEAFDRICLLLSGTISVSTLNNERAQGTFNGQGVCVSNEFENPSLFGVNNGTFNVPIVPGFE